MKRIDFPFLYNGNYVYNFNELIDECSHDLDINIAKFIDDTMAEKEAMLQDEYINKYNNLYDIYCSIGTLLRHNLSSIIKRLTDIDENSEIDLYHVITILQELEALAEKAKKAEEAL